MCTHTRCSDLGENYVNDVLIGTNKCFALYFSIGFRYEDELLKKAELENEFVVNKKVPKFKIQATKIKCIVHFAVFCCY